MQEPFERLQEARRRARFASASDAARAFGWNENTYRSHENGERGLKKEVAERYSKAFRVSLSWLMFGAGDTHHTCHVSLWGEVRSQRSITKMDSKNSGQKFELPIFVPIDSFCLRVMGEGFLPRYEENDLLICTTASHYIENQEIEGLAWDEVGNLAFGTVFGTFEKGFSIETINSKTIRDVTLAELLQVNAVVRSGRYLIQD